MIICHTENNGKIHMRWREEGIRKEITIEDFEPYFFVSASTEEPEFYQITMNIEGRRVKLEMPYSYEYGDWKDLHGKALKKVKVARPSDISRARKYWAKTYEADVPFHHRYCVDELSELKEYEMRKWYWDMEWINNDPEHGDAITAISLYDTYTEQYKVLTWFPDNTVRLFDNNDFMVFTHKDEKEMLQHFIDLIEIQDPDMLISWFGSKFDLPKLIHRMDYNDIDPRRLSPYREVKGVNYQEVTDYVDKYSPVSQPIRGRITLNLDLAFERQWNDSQRGTLPSLALDYVSEAVLGTKKLVSEKFPDKNEFFKRGWLEDTERYLEYARVDVELLHRIDDEMGLSEGILALQRLLIAPFDACFYATNMGSIYFMRNADWKAPTGDKSKMRERYDGALIYNPLSEGTNGLHLGVAAFDYAGLYPSMMLARNISWETMSPTKTEFGVNLKTPRDFSPVIEKSMVYFKTDKLGLLPRSVLELKTLRDEYKKRRNGAKNKREYTKWDNSQMAAKRLMASFYGITGYQGYGWANVTLAAAITASAREAIREVTFTVRGLNG